VAGNGTVGFSGDGGSPTAAELNAPTGIAVDSAGNLYIADTGNQRIRMVSGGAISTIAGGGSSYPGNGLTATAARLIAPFSVAVDSSGDVYIADQGDNRIREVSGGLISTIAGTGTAGFSGDNGVATVAEVSLPSGILVDGAGSLYFADQSNQRVRILTPFTPTALAITTALPQPQAVVGVAYSQTLGATGGVAPYSWSVTSGSLPAGLTLSPGGLLSGTPTATGLFNFTLQVTDSAGSTASAPVVLAIVQTGCSYSLNLSGEAFRAAGGTGAVTVTAPASCPWTASSALSWVTFTGGTSGTGNGTVSFQAAANTGAQRSGSMIVAGMPFTVEEATALTSALSSAGSLAQVTSGGGWMATLTLINSGAAAEEAVVSFYDDNGNPLALPVNYPQAPLAEPELAYSVDRTLNPSAQLLIQTAGPINQPTVAGWALVQASGNLTGSALFDWGAPGVQQEAVMQLENRTPNAFLLSFDQTGGYVLGIAVANPTATGESVPAILLDDTGANIASTTLSLPAMGHTAFMLTNDFAGAAGRRGTLQLQLPAGGQISAIGFRANSVGSLATVLPLTK
jgi:hypothetical protein